MASFSKLNKEPLGFLNLLDYLSGRAFCWLNCLPLNLSEKYEFSKIFKGVIDRESLLLLLETFEWNPFVTWSSVTDVAHFVGSRIESSYLSFMRFVAKNEYFGANYQQVSKDAMYSLTNVIKRDCIGYDAASGLLGDFSKRMVKNALVCPYSCTPEMQDAVRLAISDRFVLFDPAGKRVSHPHLKFLSEYLDDSVMNLDVRGKRVKVLGVKFDKKEVEVFENAESVHYCTMHPTQLDKRRAQSSSDALKLKLMTSNDLLQEYNIQIEALRVELKKKPGSNYVQEISDQISTLIKKASMEKMKILEAETEIKALNDENDFVTKKVCNVGAEKCKEECDLVVSMHSLYDIDIRSLLENMHEIGAKELVATVHLPFGLLFVPSYESSELGVTYKKDGKGFMMIHGSDLSNGYNHSMSEQIMGLMTSSFVHTKYGDWSYEIVDSIAELCKLRFVKASKGERIVRKLLPPKFDKYTLIMNPQDYFGPYRKRTPMLVETAKLEAAIKYVKRSKSNKEIIENSHAFVESLFMKVVVGNTELQAGGFVSSTEEDAIVLAALLEGSVRKHLTGLSYKRALGRRNWLMKIIGGIWDYVKAGVCSWFPGLVKFFTQTNAERYMAEAVSLKELILDSSSRQLDSLVGYLANLRDGVYRGFSEYFDAFPTLYEILEAKGDLRLAFARADCTEVGQKLLELTGCSQQAKEQMLEVKLKKLKSKANAIDYLAAENFIDETTKAFMEEQILPEISEARLEMEEKKEAVIDMQKAIEEEIPFDEHHHLSTEHLELRHDPVTKAAVAFNAERARLIKDGNGALSEKQKKRLVEKFTKKGKVTKVVVTHKDAVDAVDKLENAYAVDASTCSSEKLGKLKADILDLVKIVLSDGSLETINEKEVEVINGYAGSGKTRRILEEFDVSQDSYVSPLAEILFAFYKDLKKAKGEDVKASKRKDMVKTYEKIKELRRGGRVLFIDEASKFSFGYLIFLLAYTKYEKYVFVGDIEQTGHFDPTALAGNKNFTHLVPKDCITRYYYTFRFGPTVAAFNNRAFNYPVFSLKETDTRINYRTLDEFNETVAGTNISVTSETVDEYIKNFNVGNMKTAVSVQGITAPVVNLVLKPNDEVAAVSFRSNGIVMATRATEELNIFIDHVSKKTKARKNFEDLRENFAHMFDVVIPNDYHFCSAPSYRAHSTEV